MQKSKNKNAGMVTSGRAWGDLNGGSVPMEGQGRRPHAACPSSCSGQTGHGEREQKKRVSSWGQGPQGGRGTRELCLLLGRLGPQHPCSHLQALVSQSSRRARGDALGCSRDVGLDPATLGAFAGWASLAQLIRAPQDPGWELLPSGTAGCQGGGVPLVLASHPSPPAHQYHRGILPTGVGPGQPCCLSPHPVPVPYEPK